MLVSEVIKRLQQLQEEYGDVECDILYDDYNYSSGIDKINEIDVCFDDEKGTNPEIYIAHKFIEQEEV